MEINEIKTNPWKHPYYSLIKNMYHPFLYHNHLYCELTEENLDELLAERDAYVIIMELRIVGMALTLEERNWVYYLRDCCLFEKHKRKYNHVMTELLNHSRINLRPGNWQSAVLGQHSKVIQWLRSNQEVYATGDFLRENEYPEQLEETIYTAPDSPHVSEEYIDFLKLPPENPVNPNTKIIDFKAEPLTKYIKRPPLLGHKVSDSELEFPMYPGQTFTTKEPEVEKRSSVLVMWPDYPREMLEKYPELFVPRTVESLGKLMSDREYIKQYSDRKHEIKILAQRRDRILQEYKRLEAEKKRQEEVMRQRKARDDEIRQQLLAKMEEIRQEREIKEKTDRLERYYRSRGQALNADFVGTAITIALTQNYSQPKKNMPVAEQATTSKDDRIVITWDEITETISEMNIDVKEKLAKKERKPKTKIGTPPSSTESYIVEKAKFDRFLKKHSKKEPPKRLDIDDCGGYIGQGTYIVPQTGSNYNVVTGMPLITHRDDEFSDSEIDEGDFQDDYHPYEYAEEDDFQDDYDYQEEDSKRPIYPKICPDVCEASLSSSENNDYDDNNGKEQIYPKICPEDCEPSSSLSEEKEHKDDDGKGQVYPEIRPEDCEASSSPSEENEYKDEGGKGQVHPEKCPEDCEASSSPSEENNYEDDEQEENDYEQDKKEENDKEEENYYEQDEEENDYDDDEGELKDSDDDDSEGQVYPEVYPEDYKGSSSPLKEKGKPSTSRVPPPVPKFVESDKDSDSSSSSLPSVIQAKPKTACVKDDDDDASITSEDIRKFDLDYSIEDTEPPDELFLPTPPQLSSDDGRDESTVSDSDFDCTLPEIEPDFMNLPLPETPEERKHK